MRECLSHVMHGPTACLELLDAHGAVDVTNVIYRKSGHGIQDVQTADHTFQYVMTFVLAVSVPPQ